MVKQILHPQKHLHPYSSTVGICHRVLFQSSYRSPNKRNAPSTTEFPQISWFPETNHIQLMQDVDFLIPTYLLCNLRGSALPFFIVEIEPPVPLIPAHLPHPFMYGIPMPMYRQVPGTGFGLFPELSFGDDIDLTVSGDTRHPVPSHPRLRSHSRTAGIAINQYFKHMVPYISFQHSLIFSIEKCRTTKRRENPAICFRRSSSMTRRSYFPAKASASFYRKTDLLPETFPKTIWEQRTRKKRVLYSLNFNKRKGRRYFKGAFRISIISMDSSTFSIFRYCR